MECHRLVCELATHDVIYAIRVHTSRDAANPIEAIGDVVNREKDADTRDIEGAWPAARPRR